MPRTVNSTLTIAIAMILHPTDGTVLISKRRADTHLANLWEFPGGKCHPGETPEACVIRETAEETGLAVTVLEAWPPLTYTYPERTVTLHPFLCRAQSGAARPLGSNAIGWVLPTDLGEYQFPEANTPLLARLSTLLSR